jgi:hypothetical protein
MLKLTYGSPARLDIEMDEETLAVVSKALRELSAKATGEVSFAGDTEGGERPNGEALSAIDFTVAPGPVCVTVEVPRAQVRGEAKYIEKLASFFAVVGHRGGQAHYEYREGIEFVAPTSVPVVIMRAHS